MYPRAILNVSGRSASLLYSAPSHGAGDFCLVKSRQNRLPGAQGARTAPTLRFSLAAGSRSRHVPVPSRELVIPDSSLRVGLARCDARLALRVGRVVGRGRVLQPPWMPASTGASKEKGPVRVAERALLIKRCWEAGFTRTRSQNQIMGASKIPSLEFLGSKSQT